MNAVAVSRFMLAGILAAISSIASAQSSTNFKSPTFAVNAGVGDMLSADGAAAQAGMDEMSKKFRDMGGEIYHDAEKVKASNKKLG